MQRRKKLREDTNGTRLASNVVSTFWKITKIVRPHPFFRILKKNEISETWMTRDNAMSLKNLLTVSFVYGAGPSTNYVISFYIVKRRPNGREGGQKSPILRQHNLWTTPYTVCLKLKCGFQKSRFEADDWKWATDKRCIHNKWLLKRSTLQRCNGIYSLAHIQSFVLHEDKSKMYFQGCVTKCLILPMFKNMKEFFTVQHATEESSGLKELVLVLVVGLWAWTVEKDMEILKLLSKCWKITTNHDRFILTGKKYYFEPQNTQKTEFEVSKTAILSEKGLRERISI